ncbi:MAG: transposase [Deltaproteobacteria bacterium]|nr:transposase [Deltaproteobacteria bacterium]
MSQGCTPPGHSNALVVILGFGYDVGENKMAAQKSFEFRTHGGKRPGAGRPPRGPRSSEKHKARPAIDPRHPLHVVIRARPGLKLRRRAGWLAVRRALEVSYRRRDFRVCHVSVQATHVHLIVEADDHMALARGMQGFQVACARRFNLHTRRSGGVFADRYHPRPLSSLREVRNGLAYVLNNWRRHREDTTTREAFDPFASARAFDGWAGHPRRAHLEPVPVVMPTTWHLTQGWRRCEPISPHARPGPIDGGGPASRHRHPRPRPTARRRRRRAAAWPA